MKYPTPWVYGELKSIKACNFSDGNGNYLFSITGKPELAPIIVTAVNSHHDILEALKQVRDDLFYQIEAKFGAEFARQYPSIVFAEEAIRKALNP